MAEITGPLADKVAELIRRASGPLAQHTVKKRPSSQSVRQRQQALETSMQQEEAQESTESPVDWSTRMRRQIQDEERWKLDKPHPAWRGDLVDKDTREGEWGYLSEDERIRLSDDLGPRE